MLFSLTDAVQVENCVSVFSLRLREDLQKAAVRVCLSVVRLLVQYQIAAHTKSLETKSAFNNELLQQNLIWSRGLACSLRQC